MSATRVRAIFRKELREYRRNRAIVISMGVVPLVFLIQPLIQIFNLPAASAGTLLHKHPLLYMLGIPALAPALIAAASVVGERQQGTLEPVLTTPIRREELILGKALAVLAPALAVSYVVFGACRRQHRAVRRGAGGVRGPPRPGAARPAAVHATAGHLVDLGGDGHLGSVERLPRSAAAQHAREHTLGDRDRVGLVRRDPRDAGLALGLGVLLLVLDRLGWRVVVRPVRSRAARHRHQIVKRRWVDGDSSLA